MNPSVSWQQLHDVFYGLRPRYDSLSWPAAAHFAENDVAVSSSGSLMALAGPKPSVIDVYSASGAKLWAVVFNYSPREHIAAFGFSRERLVVFLSSGKLRQYLDWKGTFDEVDCAAVDLADVSAAPVLGRPDPDDDSDESLGVHVFDSTVVVRKPSGLVIADLAARRSHRVPMSPAAARAVHAVALSRDDTAVSLVLSLRSTVVSVSVDLAAATFDAADHEISDGPFAQIAVSPNRQLVALFNAGAKTVFVITAAFNQVLLEYSTANDSSSPYQLEWCGNDAIVLALRDEVKLVGPGQRSLSFFYDIADDDNFDSLLHAQDDLAFTIPVLKAQPDGLVIVTATKSEFLSRVPQSLIDLYQIASSHPSSLLLDCVDKLAKHASKADSNISLLKADDLLVKAIAGCLDAALEEFNPYWQKKILSAVAFGKAYCDTYYDAEEYLRAVNTLKVLNQLRSAEVAIFLTAAEATHLGWETIVNMLLDRDQHLLALKIIDLLGLEPLKDNVYVHWCCYKIKKEANASDVDLFKIISAKLLSARNPPDSVNFLSIDKISDIAFEEGRPDLCKLLINLEPSTSKKVQQYLKSNDVELALIKAFQSGDYDLSKLILLHLRDVLTISQFFKILNQNEQKTVIQETSQDVIKEQNVVVDESLFVSGDLVGSFWKEHIGKFDPEALELYYKQEDQKTELSTSKLKEFLQKPVDAYDPESDDSYYHDYRSKILAMMDYSADRRNLKSYQLELDVLDLRKKLSETYISDFYSTKTLNEVIIKLIEMNQLKQASKVVKDFKISQEKFWNLVLETYCRLGQFERLHSFILVSSSDENNLKSPIGFQAIVNACIAYNAPQDHVSLYIKNCTTVHYSDKIEMYIKNEDLVSAAGEAFKNKDIEFLNSILDRANRSASSSATIDTVKDYISKLGY